jgi:hypothetical protein
VVIGAVEARRESRANAFASRHGRRVIPCQQPWQQIPRLRETERHRFGAKNLRKLIIGRTNQVAGISGLPRPCPISSSTSRSRAVSCGNARVGPLTEAAKLVDQAGGKGNAENYFAEPTARIARVISSWSACGVPKLAFCLHIGDFSGAHRVLAPHKSGAIDPSISRRLAARCSQRTLPIAGHPDLVGSSSRLTSLPIGCVVSITTRDGADTDAAAWTAARWPERVIDRCQRLTYG